MNHENWRPGRADATLTGRISPNVSEFLESYTRLSEVYEVPETWLHIVKRHGSEYDVARGRELVPGILDAPLIVYRSKHLRGAILFAGKYSQEHLLVVVVKVLTEPDELWLSTLYILIGRRMLRRGLSEAASSIEMSRLG